MARARFNDPLLERLSKLLTVARRTGARALTRAELAELMRLYRYAASSIAALEMGGRRRDELASARALFAEAHAFLFRGLELERASLWRRTLRLFFEESPRAIRAEWKLVLAIFALTYGFALIAFFAVRSDLDLAYSLLDPGMVAQEIAQLEQATGDEPFRGNFTFGVSESSGTAGFVMGNNIRVALLWFGSALIPPLFLLIAGTNGMLLGTYTAVAWHWGQALEISSILWCHGVLEIQALILAGAAGLILVRALIAPGARTRAYALAVERARAWRVLAPMFPMLFCAGLIEGFVTPHAPVGVRVGVAVASLVLLVAWIGLGGRERSSAAVS
jgi:uncharacterized membrane protein SpoIIM required for sporulation